MLERRQQQVTELKSKHERLKVELEEATCRLMIHACKWSTVCEYAHIYCRLSAVAPI